MGWYALYKWYRTWCKKEYPDMIYWYKEYILKTPEQRKQEAELKHKKAMTALAQLSITHAMLSGLPYK